jgi:hypothetical protein
LFLEEIIFENCILRERLCLLSFFEKSNLSKIECVFVVKLFKLDIAGVSLEESVSNVSVDIVIVFLEEAGFKTVVDLDLKGCLTEDDF